MAPESITDGHEPVPQIPVSLTAYEWHLILQELQHSISVINRDTTNAKAMWDKLANKLNGTPGW